MLKVFKKEKEVTLLEILISQFWKATKEINEMQEQFTKQGNTLYIDCSILDINAKRELQNTLLKEIKTIWNKEKVEEKAI